MIAMGKDIKRITIRGNWDIAVIERHIKELLGHCKIWGDLTLSVDEYHCIKARIAAEMIKNPKVATLKMLITKYPVVMVTDIVGFILYEYNGSDFWSPWAGRYQVDLDINQHSEIGKMVRAIFKQFEFEVIVDEGYAYVTPIICQAGIPCSCFDKLFDLLDSTLHSPYFIGSEFVNELKGYRSYLLDSSVRRYFKYQTEKAIDLVIQLREMMQLIGDCSNVNADVLAESDVEQRIIERYGLWNSEIKKLSKKSRRETQYYFSPKLIYDETKGVCLLIPEQTLRQDSIYKLRWKIISDGDIANAKTFISSVYTKNERNYTIAANVPIECASHYLLELSDDDEPSILLTKSWSIEGLHGEKDILTFKEDGSLMSPKYRYLSSKGLILILDRQWAKMIEERSINKLNMDLPKSWTGSMAFRIYSAQRDAVIRIQTADDSICIENKRVLDIDLMQTKTLFDEKYNSREIAVYTSFPTIQVSGDLGNYNSQLFNQWQLILIHRHSNLRHTLMVTPEHCKKVDDSVWISLDQYALQDFTGLYGAYELRIYDGTTKKYFTFYLSPTFEYMSQIETMESDRSINHRRAAFYVKKNELANLEFEKDIKILLTVNKGEEWEEISTTNKRAYINGSIVYKYNDKIYKIPFKKAIRKLEWSFWEEATTDITEIGKTKQFYLQDLEQTRWRIALHFTDREEQYDSVKVILETGKHEPLQCKEIIIDRAGNAVISLNLFYDTIQANLLPQMLKLYVRKGYDDYKPICLVVIKNFIELKNPKYQIHKDGPIIYWDKSDNEFLDKQLELIALHKPILEKVMHPLDDTIDRKTKNGKQLTYITLDEPLPDGIYYIDAKEKEEMEFDFFEDDEQAIPIFDRNHILCVNGQRVLGDLFDADSNRAVDWLSAAMVALYNLDWTEIFTAQIKERIKEETILFDPQVCSLLLFALLINSGEKSNLAGEIKAQIRKICNYVNHYLITNTHRTIILKILMESKISDCDCKMIIEELQLYLFSPNNEIIFDKPNMQRLWEINEKIAILMNLRCCVSDISIDFERIVSKIGAESLEQMIIFTPSTVCKSNEWKNCVEQIIAGQCQCSHARIECSEKVWGDGEEYTNLWVTEKVGRKFELVRKPPNESHTNGYEFFNKNYLTLIFELIPDPPNDHFRKYTEVAERESVKIEKLVRKYESEFSKLLLILQKRDVNQQSLFYQIGRACILSTIVPGENDGLNDLRRILPLLKSAMIDYNELVYRDLILSELYLRFDDRRRC